MRNSLSLQHKMIDLRMKVQFIQDNHQKLHDDGFTIEDIHSVVTDIHDEMAETRYLIKRQRKLTQTNG